MGYKMKGFSGFKSSPANHGTTDDFLYGRNGHNPDTMEGKHEDWHTDKIEAEKEKPSPNKQIPGELLKLQGGIPSEAGDTNLGRLWKKSVKQDKKIKEEKHGKKILEEGKKKIDKVSIKNPKQTSK